jgi:ribosomal protein L34
LGSSGSGRGTLAARPPGGKSLRSQDRLDSLRRFPPWAELEEMKVRIRKSNLKRARKVGFLAGKKTRGGRKIIANQRRKYGSYRGADR